jgi:hypothetical protein
LTVRDNHAMRSRVGADWTDYVIEAELSTNDAPAGLVFRTAPDARNRYLWQFWPAKNQLRPHKQVEGHWWVIKDVPCVDVDESPKPFHTREHAGGGRAYFAPQPTAGTLQAILDDALPVTYAAEPPLFSESWWEVWGRIAEACRERGMGVGLSTYTLANHYLTIPTRYRGDLTSGLLGPVTLKLTGTDAPRPDL